jgi:cysteine desulfurase family protein (TIGR01976 family)
MALPSRGQFWSSYTERNLRKLMPTLQTETSALDLTWIRSQFPSLAQAVNGQLAVFLDGPGGTQVPQRVIDAIGGYLKTSNANTCGAYATSRRTDAVIAGARAAMADFFACDQDEVVFGPNMTTLTFTLSRAIGRDLGPGDEILLTHLDHDANVSPWRALEECGVTIRFADINDSDCTLNLADLAQKIGRRTRLVAVGYASNAVGTINDVKEVVRLAHQHGALAYIDAVHYAPHGPIDVRTLDCDFLVCSTYKFFGPHMGVLYGKREHLQRLPTPTLFPTAGSGARSIMNASPESMPASITLPTSAARLIPRLPPAAPRCSPPTAPSSYTNALWPGP